MGIEYYIVKPSKKEKFYLGKRISFLEGLHIGPEAHYAKWEWANDVNCDLQENARYFLEGIENCSIKQLDDFSYAIYDFCRDKVFLGNDCSEDFNTWKDYKEIDLFEDIFELSKFEKWNELYQLVPQEYWVTKEEDGANVLYEFETVERYLQKLKEGTK